MPQGPMWPEGGPRSQGTRRGNLTGFPGPSGQGKCLQCFPGSSGPRGFPVHCPPLLLFYPSLPTTPLGPMRPEGAPEGRGPGSGAQQASRGPSEQGRCPPCLPWSSKPLRVPPGVRTPPLTQPPLRGTGPVWPPLLLPPHSPPHPTQSLGGSSHLLGLQGPPPASGRCPSCGKMRTPRPPMLPSWLRALGKKY